MNGKQKQFKYIDLPNALRSDITHQIKTNRTYLTVGLCVIDYSSGWNGYIYRADNQNNVFLVNIATNEVVLEEGYTPFELDTTGSTAREDRALWPSQAEQDNFISEVI